MVICGVRPGYVLTVYLPHDTTAWVYGVDVERLARDSTATMPWRQWCGDVKVT